MTLVTLKDVLQPALKEGYAVAGLVTLGWEEMRAYVAAAEAEAASLLGKLPLDFMTQGIIVAGMKAAAGRPEFGQNSHNSDLRYPDQCAVSMSGSRHRPGPAGECLRRGA